MKALVITAAGQAGLTDLEKPQLGPEDVLIRSRAVGICGSDVELYRGIRPVGYYRYPVIPGHEWAGEVVAVGERVHNLSPGQKVVSEGFLFCGRCRNCRIGLTNLCEAGYDEIGLQLNQLITHRFPLAEYQTALDTLVSRQAGTLKVLLLHEGGKN